MLLSRTLLSSVSSRRRRRNGARRCSRLSRSLLCIASNWLRFRFFEPSLLSSSPGEMSPARACSKSLSARCDYYGVLRDGSSNSFGFANVGCDLG